MSRQSQIPFCREISRLLSVFDAIFEFLMEFLNYHFKFPPQPSRDPLRDQNALGGSFKGFVTLLSLIRNHCPKSGKQRQPNSGHFPYGRSEPIEPPLVWISVFSTEKSEIHDDKYCWVLHPSPKRANPTQKQARTSQPQLHVIFHRILINFIRNCGSVTVRENLRKHWWLPLRINFPLKLPQKQSRSPWPFQILVHGELELNVSA
jgi:hypothetical protein